MMRRLIYLVLVITSIAYANCLECDWETRFNPEKAIGFHYPHSRPGEMDIVSGMAHGTNMNINRRRHQRESNEEETNTGDNDASFRMEIPNYTGTSPIPTESRSKNDLPKRYNIRRNVTRKHELKEQRNTTAKKARLRIQDLELPLLNRNDSDLYNLKTTFCPNITNITNKCESASTTNKNSSTGSCSTSLLLAAGVCKIIYHANALDGNDTQQQLSSHATSSKTGLSNVKTVHIVGLFAMSGEYPAGVGYLPAALLAIRQINNDPTILPGYKLQLNVHDTRCSPEWGLDGLYTELYNKSRTSIMTLGTTCSHVTATTATVSNIWGMVQISYSAVSPHLSNKTIFPSFFRVTTPEQILTTGRMHMFKAMNWSRVHTIYQNFKLFSTLNEQMIKDLKKSKITVVSSNMFTTDPIQSVKRLKDADARIIIGSFYEDMARMVMCAAYNLPGGYAWYKNVVWFLPSFLDRGWMDVPYHNCSPENIAMVIGQYFVIGSINYNLDPSYRPVGNTSREVFEDYRLYNETVEDIPREFLHLYSHCNRSVTNCSLYAVHRAPQAFDAIWAIALALNNTLNYLNNTGDLRGLEDFDYGKKNLDLSCIIRQAMQNVTFSALLGLFEFNSNREGSTNVGIERYNNDPGRNFTVVGNCTKNNDDGKWSCYIHKQLIRWNTANGLPPYDGIQTRMRAIVIGLGVRIAFLTLACIGIVTSLCLLVFNTWKRNHRIIKMSSPRLNNLILMGSVLGYVDNILQDNGEGLELNVCKIRLFTKPLSFCLMFGSLFAKTWRVYQIFTAGAHAYKLNKKILRDSSLFMLVAGLVAITCGILGTWMVISPQELVTTNISVSSAQDISHLDVDIVYVNQFHHCASRLEREFTIGLSVFHGLMMIFGTFLAIQTRKVSYPEFNDSRLIAMAIYNVVVVEPVGRIMTWAINDKPELRYVLYCVMQITMSSVTLGLLFVPKVISYRRHNRKTNKTHGHHSVTTDFRQNSNRTTETVDSQSHGGVKIQAPYFDNNDRQSQSARKEISIIGSQKLTETFSSINGALTHDNMANRGNNIIENITNESEVYNTHKNRKERFQNVENITANDTKKKFENLKISPLAFTEVVLHESVSKAHRSILFKRSLSDTNIWSAVHKEGGDALKGIDIGSLAFMSAKKPSMTRHFSTTYHDDTFIQEVKFKAGVKVKAWAGIFRRSNMGMKASWKQKSYTKKTDTGSTVDLILE